MRSHFGVLKEIDVITKVISMFMNLAVTGVLKSVGRSFQAWEYAAGRSDRPTSAWGRHGFGIMAATQVSHLGDGRVEEKDGDIFTCMTRRYGRLRYPMATTRREAKRSKKRMTLNRTIRSKSIIPDMPGAISEFLNKVGAACIRSTQRRVVSRPSEVLPNWLPQAAGTNDGLC